MPIGDAIEYMAERVERGELDPDAFERIMDELEAEFADSGESRGPQGSAQGPWTDRVSGSGWPVPVP
jgi:hypothetical protein